MEQVLEIVYLDANPISLNPFSRSTNSFNDLFISPMQPQHLAISYILLLSTQSFGLVPLAIDMSIPAFIQYEFLLALVPLASLIHIEFAK